MNEHEIHEMLYKHICKEISMIADQIQKSGTMSDKDLERLDKLYHTKKDMLTAKAMADSEEYEGGISGYRGRSPMTGRYISRESNNSYTDGYSQGYSEAMNMMHSGEQGNNGGNSGHYPMPQYPYPDRRW
jgi:hypothetical protein